MAARAYRKRTVYPVNELVERLEAAYGTPPARYRFDPMDELVSCILSQHTSDANSYPAFDRLKKAFPSWDGMVAAGPEQVAEVVRSAGLANQKAKSIVSCLSAIKDRQGSYNIDHLAGLPIREARDWLVTLPGVGPKTASIVLCFAFGMPVVPVDTHVYRVSWRLGLIPEGIGEDKAHDLLLELVPGEYAYRFHMALIQHGRSVCKARVPLCQECVISDLCRWFRERVAGDGLRVTGDGERLTGDGERVTGDGEQVTGDGERVTGDRIGVKGLGGQSNGKGVLPGKGPRKGTGLPRAQALSRNLAETDGLTG